MCWTKGKVERRYAGVTHLNIDKLDNAASQVKLQVSGKDCFTRRSSSLLMTGFCSVVSTLSGSVNTDRFRGKTKTCQCACS